MARPRSITPPDEGIVDHLRAAITEHQRSPSVRELADRIGLATPSAMHRRLLSMRDKGLVTWEEGKARTLRPAETSVSEVETPSS